MRQTKYLKGVLAYYQENDIIQGDPNEGKWEEAHTPLPRSMGDDTVLLLHEHHTIHDLYQSRELGVYCCFSGDVGRTLYQSNYFQSNWFELCNALEQVKNSHLDKVRNPVKAGKGNLGTKKPWAGKNTNLQIWESTIDGYRSTASGVAQHNINRGWDRNARVYIGPKPE